MTDKEACSFIEQHPSLTHYKIGLELYLRYGRPFIEHLINTYKLVIFLDLKLHDIPETVGKALLSLSGMKIDFITLHLFGGSAMIKRAVEIRQKALPQLKLLGVTYLTSLGKDEQQEIFGNHFPPIEQLAKKAVELGLDGLVASAQDLTSLQNIKTLKVCPGIRFKEDETQDQKKTTTPDQALSLGADYLVIGRSLTQSKKINKRIAELRLLLPPS